MKHLTTLSILLTLCLFAGIACADETHTGSWSTLMKAEETTWQVLNVVDMMQTLDLKNHPNLHEGSFSESMGSSAILGEHPSDAKIVGWMAVNAVVHFGVSDYLARHDSPKWMQQTWQVLTITGKASVVDSNFHLGMRVKF